jgi:hypothetical protein
MIVSRQDDGSVAVAGFADVRVKHLVYTYTYTIQVSEVWKDGRLMHLDSTTNDDGKRYNVTAVADGPQLRVKVNGQEHPAPPEAWATTYWHLPDASKRNGVVALVDADTGRVLTGTLQHVGTNAISVGGQAQNCAHYRLTGAVQVDLWYDAQERLVREETVEDGHRTVLELMNLGLRK